MCLYMSQLIYCVNVCEVPISVHVSVQAVNVQCEHSALRLVPNAGPEQRLSCARTTGSGSAPLSPPGRAIFGGIRRHNKALSDIG